MKIIDLLNKIANGEEVIIKEGINKYCYSKLENDYITGMGYDYEHYFSSMSNILNYLNDEVEIIEDTPKEEKKINRVERKARNLTNLYIKDKLNEIIDKLNGDE